MKINIRRRLEQYEKVCRGHPPETLIIPQYYVIVCDLFGVPQCAGAKGRINSLVVIQNIRALRVLELLKKGMLVRFG
jgi:hypothetical protein